MFDKNSYLVQMVVALSSLKESKTKRNAFYKILRTVVRQ